MGRAGRGIDTAHMGRWVKGAGQQRGHGKGEAVSRVGDWGRGQGGAGGRAGRGSI